MPRNIKTSNVLKLLNLKEMPNVGDAVPSVPSKQPEDSGAQGTAHPTIPDISEPPQKPKRPRKVITKHMKLEKLSEPARENPALKAIAVENNEDRVFMRSATERQIVSIPLMLVNEQLGAAVERFNSCACDECLRGITDSALDLIPPMYVRVVNAADEDEVNRLIKEQRPEAIRALAKICIAANKKPFHDN